MVLPRYAHEDNEFSKDIVINAPANSAENRYVNQLKINNKLYDKNYLSFPELTQGATLDFEMSPTPNKRRGTAADAAPFSLSKTK